MEQQIISKIAEFGIGIFALAVLGYILYYFIKSHKDELNASRSERENANNSLMNYIEDNNHQKTEMIKEHTGAMVNVGKAIEAHTKTIERLVDKM